MKNIILIIWQWLKHKFQDPVKEDILFGHDLGRKERRILGRMYKDKYSGKRRFTKTPPDHIINLYSRHNF